MGGWTEDDLLDFMKVFKNVFGRDIEGIKDAEQEWVCKRFTNGLFRALEWTQVVNTEYVDVSYVGKGDVNKITVKKDFCLTSIQCKNIANFIAGRIQGGKIGELHTFAVMNYIKNGVDLWTNYVGVLERMYERTTAAL